MNPLLKIIIACLVISCIFSSCKKNKVAPALTVASMRFDINGVTHTLDHIDQRHASNNDLFRYIYGYNYSSGTTRAEQFTNSLFNGYEDFKAGDTFTPQSPNEPTANLFFTYNPDGGQNSFTSQRAKPSGVMTITDAGPNFIRGKFSGILYASGDYKADTVVYTITNGEFYIK
jgi:hypothetical protein